MKVSFNFADLLTADQVYELNSKIQEKNLRQLISEIEKAPTVPNHLGGADYLPLLTIFLGSKAITASIDGLVEVINNYLDLKKQVIKEKGERQVEIKIEEGDKKKTFKTKGFDADDIKKIIEQTNSFSN